jgi:hypothetical protein
VFKYLDLKLLMVSRARWSGVRRKHKISFFSLSHDTSSKIHSFSCVHVTSHSTIITHYNPTPAERRRRPPSPTTMSRPQPQPPCPYVALGLRHHPPPPSLPLPLVHSRQKNSINHRRHRRHRRPPARRRRPPVWRRLKVSFTHIGVQRGGDQ